MTKTTSATTALIVPSNREESFIEFIKRWWIAPNTHYINQIYLVWDGPEASGALKKLADEIPLTILTWEGMPDYFSKKDSAIRSYGFLEAYNDGHSHFITMDDDCYPLVHYPNYPKPESAIIKHLDLLTMGVPFAKSTVEGHIRGLPYHYDELKDHVSVSVSVGLWEGVPDSDAVHSLVCQYPTSLTRGQILVHPQQFIPMCGMNLAFTREVLPLMYFPLMGLGQPYARFDDIWCGLFAQKVMHHLGLNMSYGEPYVYHSRASDPYINLIKEAPGLPINEVLWKDLKNIQLNSGSTSLLHCYGFLAHQISRINYLPPSYRNDLRRCMLSWIDNFLP